MAEEKYTNEEEYEFSDSSSDSLSEESVQLPGPEVSPLRRYALIGVGLLLVIFVVYKMLGIFFGSEIPKKPAAPIPKPPVVQEALPMQFSQPIAPVAVAVPDELNKKIAALEIASEARKNQVNSLRDEVANVNSSVAALDAKLVALTSAIETLAGQLQAQQSRLATALRKQASAPAPLSPRPVQVADPYQVQAIIPGRAWLTTKSGNTLTVREGSHIPGLGRVIQIDTHQGLVRLNSGDTIRFAADDS